MPDFEPEKEPEWFQNLTDSKKLTKKRREALAEIILKEALASGLGWVSARELDYLGMSEALKLGARRAVQAVRNQNVPFTEIIIDGTVNFLAGTTLENHVTTLKKADFLIKEVSAASIIAKVARDNYMTELAEKYPGYGFESHVGYGTAAHQKAIEKLGLTPEHRQSFKPIAKISPTTRTGNEAEQIVASYLVSKGHTIITRNHRTKFYEIDIISADDQNIYFTEVKYRKTGSHGTALESITKKKQAQMRFAAESFLKFSKTKLEPKLAVAAVSGADFHLDDWFILSA